ncbi:Purine nucleoside phosphorylase [Burkholderia singularis]|uniref:Purine nucleoside phosphorylase n=1 Tax=Burkholderia singularis TaxID=1503053 RepID=A0A238HCW1_9BURK|nr:Purine nucleoside phosphorylase [Burkholderia singularis]
MEQHVSIHDLRGPGRREHRDADQPGRADRVGGQDRRVVGRHAAKRLEPRDGRRRHRVPGEDRQQQLAGSGRTGRDRHVLRPVSLQQLRQHRIRLATAVRRRAVRDGPSGRLYAKGAGGRAPVRLAGLRVDVRGERQAVRHGREHRQHGGQRVDSVARAAAGAIAGRGDGRRDQRQRGRRAIAGRVGRGPRQRHPFTVRLDQRTTRRERRSGHRRRDGGERAEQPDDSAGRAVQAGRRAERGLRDRDEPRVHESEEFHFERLFLRSARRRLDAPPEAPGRRVL